MSIRIDPDQRYGTEKRLTLFKTVTRSSNRKSPESPADKKITNIFRLRFFGPVEILFLSCDWVIFFDNYESDPLSPPEGEATQGERPLDPPAEFLLTFYGPIPVRGMLERKGGGGIR